MKNPARRTVSNLEELPNIGRAMAGLKAAGVHHPHELTGKSPFALFDTLCAATGRPHDLCVIDVFMSAIHFMETGKSRPWWHFTNERKNP
jgi:hypothetical protein